MSGQTDFVSQFNDRGVATCTQKRICVNILTILMDSCGTKRRVRRTNFNISKSNFDRIVDDVCITSS